MLIRPATAADVDALLALERALPTAPHWPEAVWRGLPGSTRALLVAEEDGVPVGFAVAGVTAEEGELESVGVLPASQGQGIGGAIVREALRWCVTHGARTVLLEVRASGVGAQSVYRRAGFAEIGRRPGYYADPPDDAVLMRWAPSHC